MTVLITGFEPFGGECVNPSWLAATHFAGAHIAGHDIITACLPTAFDASLQALQALLDEHQPQLVIAFGQAAFRSRISLERVAININDARIPDNDGAQPIDTPVIAGGEAAYFSRLPIKAILQTLQTAGIPAEISNSAGTYVCNHVFYGLLHYCANYPGMRAGFVHIPFLPEQAVQHKEAASMSLENVICAIEIIIRCSLETPQDIHIAAGSEC